MNYDTPNTSKQDFETICKIAKRAIPFFQKVGIREEPINIIMDIEYTHELNPLKLNDLLKADEENFLHDVFGIYKHFNRSSKQLEDCFSPRYSA